MLHDVSSLHLHVRRACATLHSYEMRRQILFAGPGSFLFKRFVLFASCSRFLLLCLFDRLRAWTEGWFLAR